MLFDWDHYSLAPVPLSDPTKSYAIPREMCAFPVQRLMYKVLYIDVPRRGIPESHLDLP